MNIFVWIKRVFGFKATQNDCNEVFDDLGYVPNEFKLTIVEKPTRNKIKITKKGR